MRIHAFAVGAHHPFDEPLGLLEMLGPKEQTLTPDDAIVQRHAVLPGQDAALFAIPGSDAISPAKYLTG